MSHWITDHLNDLDLIDEVWYLILWIIGFHAVLWVLLIFSDDFILASLITH